MKNVHRAIVAGTLAAGLLGAGLVACASSDKSASARNETQEQRKARKEAEWLSRHQKTDPYTGWIYIPENNFSVTNGNVKISMKGGLGSFCLYAVPGPGSSVPLLSTVDSFCNTSFFVRIGTAEYQLTDNPAVATEARRTPYGAQMAYTVAEKAVVIVDFSFLPSIKESSTVDVLRVTVYAVNISGQSERFSLKGVFDTILGETAFSHFSTALQPSINAETQLTSMEEDLWLRSSNTVAAIQFLLNGKGISSPEAVTLANKDYLAKGTWLPRIQNSRSFSSVLAYNNSAVAINWPARRLEPLKPMVTTFYISVGIGGAVPAGEEFLASLAAGDTALSESVPEYAQTSPAEALLPPPGEEASLEPEADAARPAAASQLDTAYVQDLIDRINALENDGSSTTAEELRQLNAELDSLLETLGGGL